MMNSQFSITLYVSTEIWNPQNCWYPYKVTATTEDVLRDVVRFDHVFVKFKRNRRNNKNFEYADYLVLDCDNEISLPDRVFTRSSRLTASLMRRNTPRLSERPLSSSLFSIITHWMPADFSLALMPHRSNMRPEI